MNEEYQDNDEWLPAGIAPHKYCRSPGTNVDLDDGAFSAAFNRAFPDRDYRGLKAPT